MGDVSAPPDLFACQRELKAVLASRLFPPGSNPARFLLFVCEQFFEGGARALTEFRVGVEALGRNSSFDPKKDAIVRVEAHRTRQRLRQYYESEGAHNDICLEIPAGGYTPVFRPRHFEPSVVVAGGPEELAIMSAPALKAPPAPPVRKPAFPGRTATIFLLLAVCAGIAGIALSVWLRQPVARRSGNPSITSGILFNAGRDTVRILAGQLQESYEDRTGRQWAQDRFFEGGQVFRVPYRRIERTRDRPLYLSMRQGQSFGYRIPLSTAPHELRLYFAETVFGESNHEGGGESSRMFDVSVNGQVLLKSFDPLSDAGGENAATVRVFKDIYPANDGLLDIKFRTVFAEKANAFINGLELTPGVRGSLRPLRFAAAESPIHDSAGRVWAPDTFAIGGRLRSLGSTIVNAQEPECYHYERFGNFSYAIPVAPGTYTVRLHFAETWFGTQLLSGQYDQRKFNIYGNGVLLSKDLDVAKEAGGSLRELI